MMTDRNGNPVEHFFSLFVVELSMNFPPFGGIIPLFELPQSIGLPIKFHLRSFSKVKSSGIAKQCRRRLTVEFGCGESLPG